MFKFTKNEEGYALLTTLLFLVIITLIGLFSINISSQETRMTSIHKTILTENYNMEGAAVQATHRESVFTSLVQGGDDAVSTLQITPVINSGKREGFTLSSAASAASIGSVEIRKMNSEKLDSSSLSAAAKDIPGLKNISDTDTDNDPVYLEAVKEATAGYSKTGGIIGFHKKRFAVTATTGSGIGVQVGVKVIE